MSEDKFDLILTILEQIQEKLHFLSVKIFSSEEKGSEFKGMVVPQDFDPLQTDLEGEKEVGRITGLSTPLNPSLEGVLNGKQDTNSKPSKLKVVETITENPKPKIKEEITKKDMIFSESIKAIPYTFKDDGKVKSYILINEETQTYAFTPGWVINAKRLPRVEIINAAFEKGYKIPKWKVFEKRFWEEERN